jgi:hypothetical protein
VRPMRRNNCGCRISRPAGTPRPETPSIRSACDRSGTSRCLVRHPAAGEPAGG